MQNFAQPKSVQLTTSSAGLYHPAYERAEAVVATADPHGTFSGEPRQPRTIKGPGAPMSQGTRPAPGLPQHEATRVLVAPSHRCVVGDVKMDKGMVASHPRGPRSPSDAALATSATSRCRSKCKVDGRFQRALLLVYGMSPLSSGLRSGQSAPPPTAAVTRNCDPCVDNSVQRHTKTATRHARTPRPWPWGALFSPGGTASNAQGRHPGDDAGSHAAVVRPMANGSRLTPSPRWPTAAKPLFDVLNAPC